MDDRYAVGARYRYEPHGQEFVITNDRGEDDLTLTPVTRPVQQPDSRFRGESFPIPHMTRALLDGVDWTYLGAGAEGDAWAGWRQ